MRKTVQNFADNVRDRTFRGIIYWTVGEHTIPRRFSELRVSEQTDSILLTSEDRPSKQLSCITSVRTCYDADSGLTHVTLKSPGRTHVLVLA